MIDLAAVGDDFGDRHADVCIVGAGVAGQTVARRLAAAGKSVILAESGGADFDNDIQSLATGPNLGEEYYPLRDSRLRLFGGTTAIWGGRSVALDPIDFIKRDWIKHSGWPITYEELDPYVDEAFAALDLQRPRAWSDIGEAQPPFDPDRIDARIWAFDQKGERFTSAADLDHPKIELILNATLTSIRQGEGGAVEALVFRSLAGTSLTVKADDYVIAAGGIETPRLLLACGEDRPNGVGNDHDLVGRFFMEHPHARGGAILPVTDDVDGMMKILSLSKQKIYHDGRRFAAAYRPGEAAQAERGILNSALSFGIRRHAGQKVAGFQSLISSLKHSLPAKRSFRSTYQQLKKATVKLAPRADSRIAARWLRGKRDLKGLYAVVRAEQAPNPDSRVRLVDEVDALGVRRAGLDWRFLEVDRRSVAGLMGLLDEELQRIGAGRAEPADWLVEGEKLWDFDPLISSHPIGGYHHMGTTRMGASPSEGVTDAECRVYGAPNLFVAGSSLFPTSGWANPTITIIALALRLGDFLGKR